MTTVEMEFEINRLELENAELRRLIVNENIKNSIAKATPIPMPPMPHGCHCSSCGRSWKTTEYPSVCPKCGQEWT